MVKFTVEIVQDKNGMFVAYSRDVAGEDVVTGGSGLTPCEALHELINELEEMELYRPE